MTNQIKDMDTTLHHLFNYANNRQVQSNVQKLYMSTIQRCFNLLKASSSNMVPSLAAMLIKVVLNILAQLSIYNRKFRTRLGGQELIVPVAYDSFFAFVRNSLTLDDQLIKNEHFIVVNDIHIDSLQCFFNLLYTKLRSLDEPLDLSVNNLFNYLIATRNFASAILMAKYFIKLKKQLIFHLLSQYFFTLNINKGELISPV